VSDGLSYDAIVASLALSLSGEEVKMVAGLEHRDAGMDTVRLVIYDRVKNGEHVERRAVLVQGTHALNDTIIDYEEGW
jgi:cystathionine beta-lyase family protein involved in aluminum resistance